MSDYPDKTTNKDVFHALTKGGISSIPVIGALAAEIFGIVIAPPMEKRRVEWMNDIAERLKALEDAGEIRLEDLRENDEFLDVVLQATTYALKTSEQEKIEAFKNALVNTALGESPSKVKSHMFLSQLDRFTVWHIKLLDFIDDPQVWFAKASISVPHFMAISISGVIINAFPEIKGYGDLIDVIWDDLKVAGFHNTSGIRTTMSGDGALSPRTTPLGKEFLAFIS